MIHLGFILVTLLNRTSQYLPGRNVSGWLSGLNARSIDSSA